MDNLLNISFHDIDQDQRESMTAVVEAHCRPLLENFGSHIIGMRVIVSAPGNRHAKGRGYHVMIETYVHDKTLVASHPSDPENQYKDVTQVIADACKVMERQLEDYVSRLHDGFRKHLKSGDDISSLNS
jgi:hypothetical protein